MNTRKPLNGLLMLALLLPVLLIGSMSTSTRAAMEPEPLNVNDTAEDPPWRPYNDPAGLTQDLRAPASDSAAQSSAGSHTWETDADFAGGTFDHTEVVSGSNQVTLLRRWGPNVRVNDDVDSVIQYEPNLAMDASGNLHAVWCDFRNGNADIYTARSTDGGNTWSANVQINDDNDSADQRSPILALDGSGNLYAAWEDDRNGNDDIYTAYSTDGGTTWLTNTNVISESGSALQYSPSLVVDNDSNLYLAWADQRNGNADIYTSRSTDGGKSWGTNIQINDDTSSLYQQNPILGIDKDNGTLHVVWHNVDIYFAKSTNGGETWSDSIQLNDDAGSNYQYSPSFAIDKTGNLYVAWEDERNANKAIYLTTSSNYGENWTNNVQIADSLDNQHNPSLAIDNSKNLYAAWDTRDCSSGPPPMVCTIGEIKVFRSGKDSINFRKITFDFSGDGETPILVVGKDGKLHMSWRDFYSDENGNIYSSYWPDNHNYATGSYTNIYNVIHFPTWNSLTWTSTLPANTVITFTVRVGNDPTPDAHWSDWYTFATSPTNLSGLPPARYLQWKATLSSPISTTTPSLDAVTLSWDDFNPTEVSGVLESDTTWAAANSPYLVTGNVLVSEGVTLTVEPGVTVWFSDTRALQVQGALVALGTDTQPITFTSWHAQGQKGDWVGISFSDTAMDATFDGAGNYLGGSALQHATVEYAGGGSFDYAVDAPHTAVYVDHCTIRHNGTGGLRVGGSGNYITDNHVYDNTNAGIANDGASAVITGNATSNNGDAGMTNSGDSATLNDNVANGNSGDGISNSGTSATISGNTTNDNGSAGISNSSAATIDGNMAENNGGSGIANDGASTISDNSIAGNNGGINNDGSSATIEDNALLNNTGVGLDNSGSSVIARRNVISGNIGGITWSQDGDIAYNTIVSNTAGGDTGGIYVSSGYPTIHYNTLQHNGGYALYNNNAFEATHLDARHNYWGTTSEATVQTLIFDWNDDSAKSIVDYDPYLMSVPTELTISKAVTPTSVPLGEVVTYTIVLSNTGDAVATNVVMTDPLPSGVTFGEWLEYPYPGSAWFPEVAWGPQDLAAGESVLFRFTATVTDNIDFAEQTISNTAYVNADNAEAESNAVDFTISTPSPVSVSDVMLVGPIAGIVDTSYTFTATVAPADATLPITYTWQATDMSPITMTSTQRAISHAYTWDTGGTKVITVTASNGSGDNVVSDAIAIPIESPPVDYRITLSDLQKDSAGVSSRYVITNTGAAEGTIQHTFYDDGDTYIAEFNDTIPSRESRTYDLDSLSGLDDGYTGYVIVAADQPITGTVLPDEVPCPQPLAGVSLLGPAEGLVDAPYAFTAFITPTDATPPVAYTWSPPPDAGQSTRNVTYTWAITGAQAITVAASHCGGAQTVADYHTIAIEPLPPIATGDSYESDDTCANAQPISVDGAAQAHTFHTQGDEDWLVFTATSEISYVIESQLTGNSPADVVMELYDRCDGGAQGSQDPAFSPNIRFTFAPPADDVYYVRLRNATDAVYGEQVGYQLSIRAISPDASTNALLIVAGKLQDDDPLQSNIYNVTNAVYQLARENGCSEDQITYLAPDTSLDADGDGTPDVSEVANRTNLKNAITSWTAGRVGSEQSLTLYFMDHGGYDKFYLNGGSEFITPTLLSDWISQLEASAPGVEVNVIMDACQSGSFIDPAEKVSGPGRMVIASTAPSALAYASQEGAEFSDALLNALAQGSGLKTAFDEGQWAVSQAHPDQTPWLDSDGDGVPNETEDVEAAAQRAFACAAAPDAEQWAPHIAQAEVKKVDVDFGTGEIWANVQDDQAVQRVWAVVYEPSYQPPEVTNELAPPPLLKLRLDPQGEGWYGGLYPIFKETGAYRVVIYAEDDEGLLSRPQAVLAPVGGVEVSEDNRTTLRIPVGDYETTIEIPAGAVSETTELLYRPITSVQSAPAGLTFAGRGFELDAYRDGDILSTLDFIKPVVVTVNYSEEDMKLVDETTLALYYRAGDSWSTEGILSMPPDTTNHSLEAVIGHLSEFALFGQLSQRHTVYLPVVLRQ